MRVISDVTRLLVAIEEGDDKAADRLLPKRCGGFLWRGLVGNGVGNAEV